MWDKDELVTKAQLVMFVFCARFYEEKHPRPKQRAIEISEQLISIAESRGYWKKNELLDAFSRRAKDDVLKYQIMELDNYLCRADIEVMMAQNQ